MLRGRKTIPVIDVFAGPGGLSEGFNSLANDRLKFSSVLAIEKDSIACSTLRLRSFFHQFEGRSVPEDYYKVIRGEAPESVLHRYSEWAKADRQVWHTELGKVSSAELHSRIERSLNGVGDWVLLGGPPCQAYSLVGRSRMIGVGQAARDQQVNGQSIDHIRLDRLTKFSRDVRHTLYREYLRIVAVHQPALFVMENVKGILSSKISSDGSNQRVFVKIRQDLSSPWDALNDDPDLEDLKRLRRGAKCVYRLYSFVVDGSGKVASDRDFLIKSEEYGVPQARHRVVLLGVRDDLRGRPSVLSRRDRVTVRDVIGAMPALRSGLSKRPDSAESWTSALHECFSRDQLAQITNDPLKRAILQIASRKKVKLTRGAPYTKSKMPQVNGSVPLRKWLTDRRLSGIVQHEARAHMSSDLGRYLFAAATARQTKRSPKLPDWPVFLLPEHRNVSGYRLGEDEQDDFFVDRFKVQMWDKPSSTITSHISKDGHYFIHPDPRQCRSFTVREAARLQTFPDNYFFCGTRTQQYQQVGNAVPPFLASQMAEVIAEYLTQTTADRSLFDAGSLREAEALL